jgi:hypothetical protein
MAVKPAAVAALVAAAFVSATSRADDILNSQLTTPMTMFYVNIPLGGGTARQTAPSYGLAIQGRKQSETVLIDTRMFTFAEGLLAGVEAKWLIAGALAVGGGVYMATKDKDRSNNYNNNQNNQQNSPPPPPCDPNDPCRK